MSKKKKEPQMQETKSEPVVLPKFGLAEDVLGAADKPKPEPQTIAPAPASRAESAAAEVQQKYVTFCLGKEEYALSINRVQEINRVSEITQVPNSPEHVLGVINLRGRIIPVIDLKRRLNLGQFEITRQSRIVVVENGPKVLGLLVDRVSQVLNIDPARIEEAPEEVRTGENYLQGVGKIDSRMIILLDMEKIVGGDSGGSCADQQAE